MLTQRLTLSGSSSFRSGLIHACSDQVPGRPDRPDDVIRILTASVATCSPEHGRAGHRATQDTESSTAMTPPGIVRVRTWPWPWSGSGSRAWRESCGQTGITMRCCGTEAVRRGLRAAGGLAGHGDELRYASFDMSDQVGAADGNQPVGAGLLRSMFAEAEEVGEGRQVRRPGR